MADDFMLTPTAVDKQDVLAEAKLLELETGKKISIRVVWAKMSSLDRVLYYGSYHRNLETASPPWACDQVNPAIIQMLVEWALEQDPETQGLVFGFLDCPDKEAALPQVLEQLGLSSEELVKPKTKGTKMPMSEIMRRALPATKEELIVLIQQVSPETKRPASRVRQFIRDETRAGRLVLDSNNTFNLVCKRE